MQVKHFTSLLDLTSTELRDLIHRAIYLKQHRDPDFQPL
jgi:ornithine carbamoyltransferase